MNHYRLAQVEVGKILKKDVLQQEIEYNKIIGMYPL